MPDTTQILYPLPPMLSGEQLKLELADMPAYTEEVRRKDPATRLLGLSDLYRVYIPSQMSEEIYSKLYLAMIRSLQKKGTRMAVGQQNENAKGVHGQEYRGILGGSDSFTIIGTSGIGKSSAISRAIALITRNRILEVQEPFIRVIPCVTAQCPFDCSVKGMLLEILRKIDEVLGSRYYETALRSRATTDMLIGLVSQAALNHIGLLVVDEIQNVVNSCSGKSLIGALTQLINNSGISICMVGTPECTPFFESAMQLARRSLGLQYGPMGYDEGFREFCEILFRYQYIGKETEITPAILEWLYEHSRGILSVVVSLLHDAQEIAILTGRETLDLEALNTAYQQRMGLMHDYIRPKQGMQTSRRKKGNMEEITDTPKESEEEVSAYSLKKIADRAKREQVDMVSLLKEHVTVEEVAV